MSFGGNYAANNFFAGAGRSLYGQVSNLSLAFSDHLHYNLMLRSFDFSRVHAASRASRRTASRSAGSLLKNRLKTNFA
jgi:hypothetical protein